MRRLRFVLEYDGTDFSGFQRQPDRRTVQGVLEQRLAVVCGEPVRTTAAGRTDAGVHAAGQVVHFDTNGAIPADRLERALNALLGPEMRVREVEETSGEFHARYGAVARTYHYWISRESPSPFVSRYVVFEERLAADAAGRMGEALPALLGTHDFVTFCALDGWVGSTVRTMLKAELQECGALLRVELTADAFLRSMVRSIMGVLLEVGRGRVPPEALAAALAARDRTRAAATAPPHGLCLARVTYPDGYGGAPERQFSIRVDGRGRLMTLGVDFDEDVRGEA